MFRRVYGQVLGMLVLSTVLLLTAFGITVDSELRSQLTSQGKASLSDQLCEIKKQLPGYVPGAACKSITTPSDERGQDVFYVVMDKTGNAVAKTSEHPVPRAYLSSHFPSDGFQTFTYQGHPYRVLRTTIQGSQSTYGAFIYELTTGELATVSQLTHLMLAIGGIGLLLSLGTNLFVTRRALKPAQRTWNAYQDSMVELSHELQTPLAAAGAILETRQLDEKTKNDLQAELDRASNMVKNILYLSRLRTEENLSQQEPVAVSDVTEEVAERFVPLAQHRGIVLHGHAEAGLFVNTTIEAWDRLVSTLLKNVVDHAEENTQATWDLSQLNESVVLIVKNICSKSAPENISALTSEPFVHGYGLRIVHRLAADMHGNVVIDTNDTLVHISVKVPLLRD